MRNKSIKKIHVLVAAAICAAFLASADRARSEDPDPVLAYYWKNAGEAARAIDPAQAGIAYVLTARTFCHRIGPGGSIAATDTAFCDYYYTGDNLDSFKVEAGKEACAKRTDLSYPYIFDNAYALSLFPNDTGGPGLAIGLTSDTATAAQPDGLVVIDRNDYAMRNLYLYYPAKEGYRRFTRSFRFVEFEGYLFPDSVWEVGTKLGIFSSENYRTETGVTEIRIVH